MPIRFRCSRCNRLLGIARRKAGQETRCPHCGSSITVPNEPDEPKPLPDYIDIDDLVNPVAGTGATQAPALASPPVMTRPAPPPVTRTPPKPVPPKPAPLESTDSERPLFEKDLDAVLGITGGSNNADGSKPKSATPTGLDALSLDQEQTHIVISSQKATAIVVVGVILMALSFGAGFLVGSR